MMSIPNITPLNQIQNNASSDWKRISAEISNIIDFQNTVETMITKDRGGFHIELEKLEGIWQVEISKEGMSFEVRVKTINNILKILNGVVKVNKNSDNSNDEIELNIWQEHNKEHLNFRFINTIKYQDGTFYEGPVNSNLEAHGYGTKYNENGKGIFDGNFENGQPHGYGTTYNETEQEIFNGNFKNGQPHDGYMNTYNSDEILIRQEDFVQGKPDGNGLIYALNEHGENIVFLITYKNGVIVHDHKNGLSEFENLNNVKIKIEGVDKDAGVLILTVYFTENHRMYGSKCAVATDGSGNIISSIIQTSDGKIFKGGISQDYTPIKGKLKDENGTVHRLDTVTFDNGTTYSGTVDINGLPHGNGSLTILGAMVVDIECNHGNIVEGSVKISHIIDTKEIEKYLKPGTDILDIILDPILLEHIKDAVCVEKRFGDKVIYHYYERESLEQWLENSHIDPMTGEHLTMAEVLEPRLEYSQQILEWANEYVDFSTLPLIGTTVHRLDNGTIYRGKLDANGLPHGNGSLTIPGAMVIDVKYNHGNIVEGSVKISHIIDTEEIEKYLKSGTDILDIIVDPILLGYIKDPVCVKKRFGDKVIYHYYERKSLKQWLKNSHIDPKTGEHLTTAEVLEPRLEYFQQIRDWANEYVDFSTLPLIAKNPQSTVLKEQKQTMFTKSIMLALSTNAPDVRLIDFLPK